MTRIDARGMRCPWPALRLARALRDDAVQSVELLADDPAAERECGAVAAAAGFTLVSHEPGVFHVVRHGLVNALFTATP